ncbi:hypothetical protein HUK80_01775 [Flavobacterium sp. MAH-1]|uniref:DNA alkylation repair enzyme n=1 Tax=Flavobacterium agri TaxID=2743471 RepID=A0A7Y9C5Q9_9FLAO|nr:hypothetical protein [Flavobacterium agri]NUY79608.1 hypothetical protein [Flavobacterium agri]NYA69633.1 hypothetical protein [Flavobacterium agri]
MSLKFSPIDFYKELESSLPTSTEDQRKVWATAIIEKSIAIKDLSGLLKGEQKIASRFLWLLGRIGMSNPNTLFVELPFLLDFCDQVNPIYKMSFANFWLIAGVPPENEGKAIDLSFKWLLSADTNVTIKSRSLSVLFKLTKKYPELKNELKFCLEDQMDKHSNEFRKKATKILLEISQ